MARAGALALSSLLQVTKGLIIDVHRARMPSCRTINKKIVGGKIHVYQGDGSLIGQYIRMRD